jgi:hypothetical protein
MRGGGPTRSHDSSQTQRGSGLLNHFHPGQRKHARKDPARRRHDAPAMMRSRTPRPRVPVCLRTRPPTPSRRANEEARGRRNGMEWKGARAGWRPGRRKWWCVADLQCRTVPGVGLGRARSSGPTRRPLWAPAAAPPSGLNKAAVAHH